MEYRKKLLPGDNLNHSRGNMVGERWQSREILASLSFITTVISNSWALEPLEAFEFLAKPMLDSLSREIW